MTSWIFGYGSLIWRPDIPFERQQPARIYGWQRRFWQGSHDHRGLPDAPGRVVTLVPEAAAYCDGMAYQVAAEVIAEVFETLDHREKNGYQRFDVDLHFGEQPPTPGLVYIAPQDNHAYLGPASTREIATQILTSAGPSGHNVDYLLALADALRSLDADDPHVFELEAEVVRNSTEKRP